jgi:hypothetical protein
MQRERYYVQVAYSTDHLGLEKYTVGGWFTQRVCLDREEAERWASHFERTSLWIDGRDVSTETVTIARVKSAAELLEEEGPLALRAAQEATLGEGEIRPQLDEGDLEPPG